MSLDSDQTKSHKVVLSEQDIGNGKPEVAITIANEDIVNIDAQCIVNAASDIRSVDGSPSSGWSGVAGAIVAGIKAGRADQQNWLDEDWVKNWEEGKDAMQADRTSTASYLANH